MRERREVTEGGRVTCVLVTANLRASYPIDFFFFNDTATTEIYTLSLHDALPISQTARRSAMPEFCLWMILLLPLLGDRKSTRLNSSHSSISYAVFCLKKKIKN